MLNLRPVLDKTKDYLQKQIEGFKLQKAGKITLLVCPFCKKSKPMTCNFIVGSSYKMKCLNQDCDKKGIFTVIDVVREIEQDKKAFSDEEVARHLAGLFNIELQESFEVGSILEFYESQVFDLVPIAKDQKIPVEKDWTNKKHKNKEEWADWLNTGLNLGVKTGKVSGITVVDVDVQPIPPGIDEVKGETLVQKTNKGYHLFYQYEEDLPKTRLVELHVDIENDGGQVVVAPSVVSGRERNFQKFTPIIKMPPKLKEFLLKNMKARAKTSVPDPDAQVKLPDNFDITKIGEGNRNLFMMHFGGILRKKLNLHQVGYVLHLFNQQFLTPQLSTSEFQNVIAKLDDYIGFDEHDLAEKVLKYMRIVGEAFAGEVREALGEPKQKIDSALSYLTKEGVLIKARRMFHIIRRADWKDTFDKLGDNLDFKLPYFQDVGYWQWGDMILLGSKAKYGKTTISMNMVHQLVQQGIKPYYICLETGSRFIKTALKLGMKEGDFFWSFEAEPTNIELEPNAVTILDWLLVVDKSQTDSVMKYFVEQLHKTKGLLIIFMQLKKDDGWFAPNMVDQFPALAARYLYEKEGDGEYGYWKCDAIREVKFKGKTATIPCKYDFDNKKLTMISANENSV